jgi:hypothetical protein
MANPQNASDIAQPSPIHVPSSSKENGSLNSWLSPSQYETAGGQSTRMIIDSASYSTTPCDSPPNELRHVFSAGDSHRKEPDVTALTEAEHSLREKTQMRPIEGEGRGGRSNNYEQALALNSMNGDRKEGGLPKHHGRYGMGFVPPYILDAVAKSEVAEPQTRESARQTLASASSRHSEAASAMKTPSCDEDTRPANLLESS